MEEHLGVVSDKLVSELVFLDGGASREFLIAPGPEVYGLTSNAGNQSTKNDGTIGRRPT